MDTTLTLLDLAGTIALLLWGVHMVQSGIQRAYGPDLRRFLARALNNRLKAAMAGLGVTAVLQSSTAAGLMICSFASGGFVALVPALAVMLGANIGTTLIVQLLSFDVARLSPIAVLVGVVMFRTGKPQIRDLGRVGIGLGLMLMALSHMLEIITPYEDVPSLRMLLGPIATDPVVAVLFGALITWMAHSSVAIVLLVMSFTAKGAVPLAGGMALVIGANIGTALNPLIEGARGGDPAARRVGLGNLIVRLAGAAIALPLISWIGPHLVRFEPDLSRSLADFHTAFNLALGLLFLPLLGPLAGLLERMLPNRVQSGDPAKPMYLDPAATEVPALALGHAARETLRMADVLGTMLEAARDAIEGRDRQLISALRRQHDVLDALNFEIKHYLIQLDPDGLSDDEHRRLTMILTFVLNLEQAGDIIDRNLRATAAKRIKRGLSFSPEGLREILQTLDKVHTNLHSAGSVFMTEDVVAARLLAEQKSEFRRLETEATQAHFSRLRDQRIESSETSALHLDLICDLKRINDQLVAGAAYPVLEERGALMNSRLKNASAVDKGDGTL